MIRALFRILRPAPPQLPALIQRRAVRVCNRDAALIEVYIRKHTELSEVNHAKEN